MKWYESLEKQINNIQNILKNRKKLEKQINKLIQVIEKVNKRNGTVYFTGIGKSGLVAAKISTIFNSLGIKSFFIHPIDTLHGDMGIFGKKDLVVFISKSGETKELFPLLNELKKRGIKIISVTSNGESYLGQKSDLKLVLPTKTEGDFLNNIVPLSSTITFEAVLQSIAVDIASRRNFSLKDFINRHPGGKIGETKV